MTVEPRRLVPASDVLVSHLEGEAILLHMGRKHYFRLNRTGAHIWKGIESGADVNAIADSLVQEFEVTHEEAVAAVTNIIGELLGSTLIREVPDGR